MLVSTTRRAGRIALAQGRVSSQARRRPSARGLSVQARSVRDAPTTPLHGSPQPAWLTASTLDRVRKGGKLGSMATDEAKEVPVDDDKKQKKKKDKTGDGTTVSIRKRWSKLKDSLRPTQTALGWDWVLFKMKNLTTIEDAAAYLDRKPVPCVKRGDLYYIVDHHHTLAALNASGHDVKVTLVVIMDIPEDLGTLQMFWDFMERRGFTFMRNPDYTHCDFDALPTTFAITAFHNDIYRSMGGFARVHRVLKRPKNLESRLFFEFKWGYFFYVHREDELGLWHDKRLFRSWQRVRHLVEETDMQEYVIDNMQRLNVSDCTYLSENVIEPVYQLMMFYIRALCLEYENLADVDKGAAVPEFAQFFGENNLVLPANCVMDREGYDYAPNRGDESFDDAEDDEYDVSEYGDERDYNKWRMAWTGADTGYL